MNRRTVGYVTPYIWGDISLSYLTGVLECAKVHDVNVVCFDGQRFGDLENYNYQANLVYDLMASSWIDGLVIWASQITELLDEEKKTGVVDRFPEVPIATIAGKLKGCSSIIGDAYTSVKLLVDHLNQVHGCKQIGFIRGPLTHSVAESRYEAYYAVMKDCGLDIDLEISSPCYGFNRQAGIEAADRLVALKGEKGVREIDALICASDVIAAGLLERLLDYNIRVPEDIAVVGINNKTDSRLSIPPMTTIDPEIKKIGVKAMDVLMDEITHKTKPREYLAQPKLICRRSCGCLDNISSYNLPYSEVTSSMIRVSQEQKSYIIDIIIDILEDSGITLYEDLNIFASQWLTELFICIEQPLNNDFIETLSWALNSLKNLNVDISIWQMAISNLRTAVLPILFSHKQQMRLQDICNQARVEITLASEYQYAEHQSKMDRRLKLINDTTITLRSSYVMDELFEAIEDTLRSFAIPGCYISVFDDEKDLSKTSLIFAYKDNKRIKDIQAFKGFNSKLLIPESLKESEKCYQFIVHALYFQENIIGYVVFEAGPIDKSLYQILASEVGGAIYRSRIFNSLKDSEYEREVLVHQLEERNQSLERTVDLRTKDIRLVNEQLKNAIDDANNANAAKTEFLAKMSHEIRTPLNCIIGFADMIQSQSNDESISNYIGLTIEETEKLMLMINQLLDLSKVESGKMILSKEAMSIENLMESLTSTYSVISNNKGISYKYTIDESVPLVVEGDVLRLRQVLANLISNAIKFTDVGGIKVHISRDLPRNCLEFSISDTGIGIEEDRIEAIFDEFEQETPGTSKRYGGTGLGTAISKQLVELMGGSIHVVSEKGVGSTFSFCIPYELLEDKEVEDYLAYIHQHDLDEKEAIIEPSEEVRILIVEDYPPNRMLAIAYLATLKCKVSIAVNGQEAIDMLGAQPYDLILMDVQMPVLDGVEATRIIRKNKAHNQVIIIGMTANAFESDLKNYYEAGMNDVITKPFRKENLLKTITKWLNKDSKILKGSTVHGKIGEAASEPIRYNLLLEELDGNKEFMKDLLDGFIKETKVQLVQLELAINTDDLNQIVHIAHTLKGAALNMRADQLGHTAEKLELDGKKVYTKNMIDLLETLKEQFIQITTYLDNQW